MAGGKDTSVGHRAQVAVRPAEMEDMSVEARQEAGVGLRGQEAEPGVLKMTADGISRGALRRRATCREVQRDRQNPKQLKLKTGTRCV